MQLNSAWISLSCTLKAETVPFIHCVGGWMGPTASLNAVLLSGIELRFQGRRDRPQSLYCDL
jgi:hypothetical protein